MQPILQRKEKENTGQKKEQSQGENSGLSIAPPVFQLQTDDDAPAECPPAEPGQCTDYSGMAQNVWDAMFGGTGLGTDEQQVYQNLALLNNDDVAIGEFMSFYKDSFGSKVDDDIRLEFSNNFWAGSELDQALGFLNITGGAGDFCPVETPESETPGKTPDPAGPVIDPVAEAKKKPYTVSDGAAWIRDSSFAPLDPVQSIPKWTEVYVTDTGSNGNKNYAYVKGMADDHDYGWTSTGNLYEQFWDPAEHEDDYKGISSAYNDQMQDVDPTATRANLIMSGVGVKALADQYYPNETDASKLDSGFKTKLDNLTSFFGDNGITYSLNAGLRHPLRSTIFNYAIKVAAASSTDIIMQANAVMTKYGMPIDWAHKNADGSINLATSKAKAVEVKGEFGLGSAAARGIKDFGGGISNHNNGKAVDITLGFNFTSAKQVTVGGVNYSISPTGEAGDPVAGVAGKALARIGKANYGITRSMDNDAVHWSETGR